MIRSMLHQWGLHAIEAEAAWNITRGDPSVVIAVVDMGSGFRASGIDARPMAERTRKLSGVAGVDDDGNGFVDDSYGYDFMDLDGDPAPFPLERAQSHGTHVAGIAAAARNNGQGIAGIAPDCRIMGVRAGQSGNIAYAFEGVYYASRSGARVINCSWGGDASPLTSGTSFAMRSTTGRWWSHPPATIIAAAPHYPAGIEGVLSVAATKSATWPLPSPTMDRGSRSRPPACRCCRASFSTAVFTATTIGRAPACRPRWWRRNARWWPAVGRR